MAPRMVSGRWGSGSQATHCREGEAGYNVFLIGTMEDTQRSQPISMENQEIAEQVARKSEEPSTHGLPVLVSESSLARVAIRGLAEPETVFTSLAHWIDFDLLKKSFKGLSKNESTGVDKITAKGYAADLNENLYKLYERLRRG